MVEKNSSDSPDDVITIYTSNVTKCSNYPHPSEILTESDIHDL